MEESHIHKRVAVTSAVDVITGNADILAEILLRLPARSLVRFSVVCKLWHSLITSRRFRLRHCRALANSSALPPSGFYFYSCLTILQKIESLPLADNVTSLPLATPPEMYGSNDEHVKIVQSCNGLLLYVVTSERDSIKLGFVYNPAMKELHRLPCPYADELYDCVYYNMIFDSSEPPYFKVVSLTRLSKHHGDFDVSVYVPGSGKSWRSCCRFSPPSGIRFDSGVFWNGAIHWIGEFSYIYFDADSEVIVQKDMPPKPQGRCREKIRYFGEWGGHLHLIQVQSREAKKFNVLELDKDTREWTVKYHVYLGKLISEFPRMIQKEKCAFSILSVIRGETEEDSVLLLSLPGRVVTYNLVNRTIKEVRKMPHGRTLRIKPVSAYQYTESLVPVNEWNVSTN